MNTSILQLYPKPSAEALNQQFTLIGTIDITAIPSLETLYCLPPECVVKLDFAMVQRVNSMGLAQLLKLFEYMKNRNIKLSVVNTNRMIMVLFKMTDLSRFFSTDPTQTTATPPAVAPASENPIQARTPENATTFPKTAQMIPFTAKKPSVIPRPDAKLKLWVNAQNHHQMNGWYFFNTYLQRQLKREVQMELVQGAINAKGEPIEEMDIVFTSPFMAAHLTLEHEFSSVARPIDQTDEVTLLARADEPRQRLSDFFNAKIVTTAPDNFVYLLGRFLLEEAGGSGTYVFSGHDIKALQLLLKGNADLLFMSTNSYNGLATMTRKMIKEIDRSETGFAFPLFCIAPHQADLSPVLSEVLLKMHQDSQGRQVLEDLNLEGWSIPKPDEIHMMEMLFKRYASTAPMHSQNALLAQMS